jgi:hypothetical protein
LPVTVNLLRIIIIIVVVIVVVVSIIIDIIAIITFLFGRAYYTIRPTDFVYVKFVEHNPKIAHRRPVCNFWLITFHIEFLGAFMMYLYTKYHTPSSNDSIVISDNLSPSNRHLNRLHAAIILLLYILQKLPQKLHNYKDLLS